MASLLMAWLWEFELVAYDGDSDVKNKEKSCEPFKTRLGGDEQW